MVRCLVTGDLGYIGSHLTIGLNNLGHQVVGCDLKDGSDIRDLLSISKAHSMTGMIDYIFHLAAKPRVEYSVQNPSETLDHNVRGTSIVLELAARIKAKKVIFSSSSAIYGDGKGPTSPYGLHKLMGEMECKFYAKHYGVKTICLRYFNVYSEDQQADGAYSTVIASWMDRLRQGKELIINGDGEHRRDFVHVDDVVKANIVAMSYDIPKEFDNCLVTDVGVGKNYSLNYIRDYILSVEPNVKFINGPARRGDPLITLATPAWEHFPWKPQISFESGLWRCFSEVKRWILK